MKKLTAGIFASVLGLVAFGAHADIASTGYVNSKIGGEVASSNTTQAPVGATIAAAIGTVNSTASGLDTRIGALETKVGDTVVHTVTAGTGNGTIKVDGTDLAVTGLGNAAYQNVTSTYNSADTSAPVSGAAVANAISAVNTTTSGLDSRIGALETTTATYGDIVTHDAADFDASGSAAAAQAAAISAAATDATSKASTAEQNAKNYADGLAVNYDAAGDAGKVNASLGNLALLEMPTACAEGSSVCVLTMDSSSGAPVYRWENINNPTTTGRGTAGTVKTAASGLTTAPAVGG